MQLNKFYALTLALVVVCNLGYGQGRKRSYWSINPVIGAANYVGDFSISDEIQAGAPNDQQVSLENTSFTIGANLGYHFHPRMAARLGVMYFNVRGTDEGTRLANVRGLEFATNSGEVNLMLQYDLISPGQSVYRRTKWQPYIFGGVAVVLASSSVSVANPSAVPGIEPAINRIEDGLNVIGSIPFGVGTRVRINDDWDFTAEVGLRYGLTDNLDGLLGLTNNYDDWYSLTTIGVRKIFGNGSTERCIRPRTKSRKFLGIF